MAKKRVREKKFGVILGVAVLACAIGIFMYVARPFWKPPVPPTKQGIYFEELLPEDISIVLSFNPTDADENNRFSSLLKTVMQEKADVFFPTLIDELLEQDISAVLNKNSRMLVGIDTNDSNTPSSYYFLAESDFPEFSRTGYIETLSSATQTIGSTTDSILVEGDKFYFGSFGDVIFFTNADKQKARELFNRYSDGVIAKISNKSLAGNSAFRTTINSFKKPFSGYLFSKTSYGSKNQNTLFSSGVFSSQTEGLRLETLTRARTTEQDSYTTAIFQPFILNLHKQIPIQNPMAFNETHHVGSFIYRQFGDKFLDQFKQTYGVDFKNDVEPFLNKETAISVQNGTSVLPYISIFINASGAPEKALNIIKKLDNYAPVWLELLNMSLKNDKTEPIAEETGFTRMQNGRIIKLHLNRIPPEVANIPLFQMMEEPVEISYGITDQNILFISSAPNFEQMLEAPTASENNPLFQETLVLNQNPSNILILNGGEIEKFITRFIETAKEQKRLTENEKQLLETFGKYLSALKSYIQVSQGDSKNITSTGFLKVQ